MGIDGQGLTEIWRGSYSFFFIRRVAVLIGNCGKISGLTGISGKSLKEN